MRTHPGSNFAKSQLPILFRRSGRLTLQPLLGPDVRETIRKERPRKAEQGPARHYSADVRTLVPRLVVCDDRADGDSSDLEVEPAGCDLYRAATLKCHNGGRLLPRS